METMQIRKSAALKLANKMATLFRDQGEPLHGVPCFDVWATVPANPVCPIPTITVQAKVIFECGTHARYTVEIGGDYVTVTAPTMWRGQTQLHSTGRV
jgi:hypothetical protein